MNCNFEKFACRLNLNLKLSQRKSSILRSTANNKAQEDGFTFNYPIILRNSPKTKIMFRWSFISEQSTYKSSYSSDYVSLVIHIGAINI